MLSNITCVEEMKEGSRLHFHHSLRFRSGKGHIRAHALLSLFFPKHTTVQIANTNPPLRLPKRCGGACSSHS